MGEGLFAAPAKELVLHDYQIRAIDAARDLYRQGKRRVILYPPLAPERPSFPWA